MICGVSRDIFVQDIPAGIRDVDEIPDDWEPSPLPFGHAEVVRAVLELAPTADFTDPTWGRVDLPGVAIEVNIDDEPRLESFALHVRAADTLAADGFVAQLLDRLGVRAFDPTGSPTGLFTPP
jgi:hypothetical protein